MKNHTLTVSFDWVFALWHALRGMPDWLFFLVLLLAVWGVFCGVFYVFASVAFAGSEKMIGGNPLKLITLPYANLMKKGK